MLMLPSNGNNQAVISVPVQSNGISDVDLDQRQGSVNAGNANSVGEFCDFCNAFDMKAA
jgi:hypothetical protein